MLNRFFKRKRSSSLPPEIYSFLTEKLGVSPVNDSFYILAFRHRSKPIRENGLLKSNERLEYLGDAVISMIVGEFLYKKYPTKSEGFLTQLRSRIVSRENLNHYGECLKLEPFIVYQRGKAVYKSRLGNTVEALFAAIYLDLGYSTAKQVFIDKLILENTNLDELELKNEDYKSQLIIHCQKNKIDLKFTPIKVTKDERETVFEIGVYLNGKLITSACENSKRAAEQLAAEKAIHML